MKIIARKLKNRKLATHSVPANDLKAIYAVRTIGDERKLGQYKIVDNNQVQYFRNFDALRFYSNIILRNQHKHVIIVKGEIPDDTC